MTTASFLALSILVIASPTFAMSTYTYQWASGDRLYATASTDSDYEDEYASTSLQIHGPSGAGSSSYNWDCTWYYTSLQTSLQVTAAGDYTAVSDHHSGSLFANFAFVWPFSLHTTAFKTPVIQGNSCHYTGLACTPGTSPTCYSGIGWTTLPIQGTCPQVVVAEFWVAFVSGNPVCISPLPVQLLGVGSTWPCD